MDKKPDDKPIDQRPNVQIKGRLKPLAEKGVTCRVIPEDYVFDEDEDDSVAEVVIL